jgi:hydrogenase-4 component B
MLSVAFIPQFYLNVIGIALAGMNRSMAIESGVFTIFTGTITCISLYSLLLVGIIVLIWMLRSKVLKNRMLRFEATWGCGYLAPNSRLQYTGKSFSKPLGKILNFLLIEKKHFEELKPGEIFPEKRSYVSHYHDFFEHNLFDPITQRLTYSANYFSFIQNGRIQSYVLYGIVFILAMFILTFLNIVS